MASVNEFPSEFPEAIKDWNDIILFTEMDNLVDTKDDADQYKTSFVRLLPRKVIELCGSVPKIENKVYSKCKECRTVFNPRNVLEHRECSGRVIASQQNIKKKLKSKSSNNKRHQSSPASFKKSASPESNVTATTTSTIVLPELKVSVAKVSLPKLPKSPTPPSGALNSSVSSISSSSHLSHSSRTSDHQKLPSPHSKSSHSSSVHYKHSSVNQTSYSHSTDKSLACSSSSSHSKPPHSYSSKSNHHSSKSSSSSHHHSSRSSHDSRGHSSHGHHSNSHSKSISRSESHSHSSSSSSKHKKGKKSTGGSSSTTSSKPVPAKSFDPDVHCGVIEANRGPCTRSITCTTHRIQQRKLVLGRSKDIHQLIAEKKAAKEKDSKNTSCSYTSPNGEANEKETCQNTSYEPIATKIANNMDTNNSYVPTLPEVSANSRPISTSISAAKLLHIPVQHPALLKPKQLFLPIPNTVQTPSIKIYKTPRKPVVLPTFNMIKIDGAITLGNNFKRHASEKLGTSDSKQVRLVPDIIDFLLHADVDEERIRLALINAK